MLQSYRFVDELATSVGAIYDEQVEEAKAVNGVAPTSAERLDIDYDGARLVLPESKDTVKLIPAVETALRGFRGGEIYEVWSASTESNETQHQLCFFNEA